MDVSVMIENVKFNYRVAAIIKNGDKILLHKSKKDNFFAIPGGRIMIGEDSEAALKREFLEEIGTNVFVKKYLGTIENFFEYNGKKYHELMIVYEAKFEKESDKYNMDKIVGLEEDGKIEFIWKTIEQIKELDLRPKFIKDSLVDEKDILHLINRT